MRDMRIKVPAGSIKSSAVDGPKLWTKDFTVDALVNFLVYFAHYLVLVTIAVYVMERFGGSAGEAGLAYGVYIIGGLFARLLTGNRIDHIGRKRTLVAGLVLFLAATFSYFIADSIPALMLVRLLHGFGWGVAATSTGIIVAHLIPAERVGEGTGYYALSVTLASAVGPLLGMMMIVSAGFTGVLVLSSVLATFALVAVCFLKVPEAARLAKSARSAAKIATTTRPRRPRASAFFEPSALPISIVSFFAGIGVASVFSFLTPYVQSIDLASAGEFFFMVYAAAMVATRPMTGRLFDLKGENIVMYPSFALFVLGLVVLALAGDGFMLLLAGALLGVGYGTFVSSSQALVVKRAPAGHLGLATSTFFALIDFGSGISPSILGLLVPFAGYRGLYLISAAIVLACIPLYYLLHGRKVQAARPELRRY